MLIKNSRYQTDELKVIADPVIQRNSYFAHPENQLLSMMTDDRPHIRELARPSPNSEGTRSAEKERCSTVHSVAD